MAWEEELFSVLDDLEQQAEALYDAERAPDVADRSRTEYRQVSLATRLMASLDRPVTLHLAGVGPVAGNLDRVGSGWCLLRGAGLDPPDWIVLLDAVVAVDGASTRAVPEVAWSVVARLGPASALRRLAEAGEWCVFHTREGARRDGVPRRIGADFVEVDEGVGRAPVLLALGALAGVQSRPGR